MSGGPGIDEPAFHRRQAAVIVAVTLAVFAPSLSADFVYDARMQILTDPFLHDRGNWRHVLTFGTLSMDVLDFNRPVNLASLMLDAAIWGREPFGYHLTSVLLHAVNAVMVWSVLRRLAGGLRPAWAMLIPPLLFAVHPVVTEAVCEPTFREDLLVAFFTLAGLLLAMGHDASVGRRAWPRAVACVACSLLAIGSKESGIAAPCAITVYWWLFRRGERGWFWPLAIGGAKACVAAFLVARFLFEPGSSRIFEARPAYPGGSLASAMLLEPRILALYVQNLLLPVNLCADYGPPSISHLPLPVAVAVLAAVASAAFMAIRLDRRMALAVAVVVVPLLPVANLVPIYRAAADRYLYLPMAGVGLAAGFLLDAPWLAAHPRRRDRMLVAAAAAVVLLVAVCVERQKVWAGPLPLWTDTYRKNPAGFTSASGLAEALREAARLPEAEDAARAAIRLSGAGRGEAWATLALILDGMGRTAEAFEALDTAIRVEPRLAEPDARVAALAMERSFAEDWKGLLERRGK